MLKLVLTTLSSKSMQVFGRRGLSGGDSEGSGITEGVSGFGEAVFFGGVRRPDTRKNTITRERAVKILVFAESDSNQLTNFFSITPPTPQPFASLFQHQEWDEYYDLLTKEFLQIRGKC
jgi:hypothetical protein